MHPRFSVDLDAHHVEPDGVVTNFSAPDTLVAIVRLRKTHHHRLVIRGHIKTILQAEYGYYLIYSSKKREINFFLQRRLKQSRHKILLIIINNIIHLIKIKLFQLFEFQLTFMKIFNFNTSCAY